MIVSGADVFYFVFGLSVISWYAIKQGECKKYKDKNKKLTEIAENYKAQRDKYRSDLSHVRMQEEISFRKWRLASDKLQERIRNIKSSNAQFTQQEIDTLIRLCHPDKHNGKDSAKEITQKLLVMRSEK